jgi:hypothetical protein
MFLDETFQTFCKQLMVISQSNPDHVFWLRRVNVG